MDHLFTDTIFLLQSYPAEYVSVLSFFVCMIALLTAFRLFGLHGLYLYSTIALVLANIQVLRLVHYNYMREAVPLGTVLFCTIYLASDIITEHYGPEAAKKNVWITFYAQLFTVISMVVDLGHASFHSTATGLDSTYVPQDENYSAMLTLFSPSLRLLIASLVAYMISQFVDIWVFQKIRSWSKNRYVWLRQNVSTILSGFIDNFTFSWIGWVLLNPFPITYYQLFMSYVLATYVIRILVNVMGTPFMYLSYVCKPNEGKV